MEGRPARRRGAGAGTGTSPGRNKVWVEPPGKSHSQTPARSPPAAFPSTSPAAAAPAPSKSKRVAVVYYLSRNRHLEHPHFIEVPLATPDEGLYLRDVINRLNVLRGKAMASMYSWSCKRSYKNGFVWHDLSDDDLVLPAQGNEYILKGSELLDRSPTPEDRQQNGGASNPKVEGLKQHPKQESPQSRGSQEGCSSSSSPSALVKEISPPPATPRPQLTALLPSSSASTNNHEDELCPTTTHSGSSGNQSPEPAGTNAPLSEASSPGPSEYRVCRPIGAQDVATQTDDSESDVSVIKHTRMAGMSMDTSDAEIQECHERISLVSPKRPEIVQASPAPCSSDASPGDRVETLESLIRAEASRRSSFRTLAEEEHMFGPMGVKLKPANLLMQLITCGSISVKEHRGFGIIPTYKPRFTQVEFPSPMFSTPVALRHLDKIPCNTRTVGMRAPESEYFSGSLVEAKMQDESGRGISTLKRSSSYDEDRVYRTAQSKSDTEGSAESGSFRCLPQTIRIISCKQSRNGTILSPASDVRNSSSRQEYSTRSSPLGSSKSASNRMTDPSPGKLSSARVESFHEEKDVIKIEERLPSGARVIIQSAPLCEESDDSNESLCCAHLDGPESHPQGVCNKLDPGTEMLLL